VSHAFDLTGLAVVVLAASLLGYAMTRLRQSPTVGYILTGILLGPNALGMVHDRAGIESLAELGVLLLLFVIGLELNIATLRASWRVAVTTTLLQVAASAGTTLLLALVFDWSWTFAILLGFVVALSSTAVVVRMLVQMDIVRQPVGQLTIAVLIAQDLAFIPMLLVVRALSGGTVAADHALPIVAGVSILAALLLYFERQPTIRLPFAAAARKNRELLPLRGLMFCFGLAALAGVLGLSAAYGAFLAGFVLGNSEERRPMRLAMQPIEAVLVMVFFLLIGLLIDLEFIADNLIKVLTILLAVVVLKTAMNIGILRFLREPWPHAVIAGVMLAQIGEFSFLLSQVGLQLRIVGPDESKLIIAVTALSLMVTPLWMLTARRLLRIVMLSMATGRDTLQALFGRVSEPVVSLRRSGSHFARRAGSRDDAARESEPTEGG
jgi:CPA2 family monovalent cation:H+ antiporter-2